MAFRIVSFVTLLCALSAAKGGIPRNPPQAVYKQERAMVPFNTNNQQGPQNQPDPNQVPYRNTDERTIADEGSPRSTNTLAGAVILPCFIPNPSGNMPPCQLGFGVNANRRPEATDRQSPPERDAPRPVVVQSGNTGLNGFNQEEMRPAGRNPERPLPPRPYLPERDSSRPLLPGTVDSQPSGQNQYDPRTQPQVFTDREPVYRPVLIRDPNQRPLDQGMFQPPTNTRLDDTGPWQDFLEGNVRDPRPSGQQLGQLRAPDFDEQQPVDQTKPNVRPQRPVVGVPMDLGDGEWNQFPGDYPEADAVNGWSRRPFPGPPGPRFSEGTRTGLAGDINQPGRNSGKDVGGLDSIFSQMFGMTGAADRRNGSIMIFAPILALLR